MSTDRELLEMAAKAAGYTVLGYISDYDYPFWSGPLWGLQTGFNSGVWNSLEDDGDSLRLLRRVDYGLLVEYGTVKIMNNLGGCVLFLEIRDADEMTVIRRAITMAAAAARRPGENDVPN